MLFFVKLFHCSSQFSSQRVFRVLWREKFSLRFRSSSIWRKQFIWNKLQVPSVKFIMSSTRQWQIKLPRCFTTQFDEIFAALIILQKFPWKLNFLQIISFFFLLWGWRKLSMPERKRESEKIDKCLLKYANVNSMIFCWYSHYFQKLEKCNAKRKII